MIWSQDSVGMNRRPLCFTLHSERERERERRKERERERERKRKKEKERERERERRNLGAKYIGKREQDKTGQDRTEYC